MPIFTFRAKLGQEKALATMFEVKGAKEESGVYAMVLSDTLKGYAFIEGETQIKVEEVTAEIRTVSNRAILGGKETPIEELSNILNPRPVIDDLEIGSIVEIIDGPFKGLKAKLSRIETEEIIVELIDSAMSLPVKINADYVKKIASDKSEKEDYGKFAL